MHYRQLFFIFCQQSLAIQPVTCQTLTASALKATVDVMMGSNMMVCFYAKVRFLMSIYSYMQT